MADDILDNKGHPVSNYENATAITLESCYRVCGNGSEPFSFPDFAQESSAWFVPWLALLSQLPFGANDLFENANYIIMALGSPTLFIYSLSLSAINTRWIVASSTLRSGIPIATTPPELSMPFSIAAFILNRQTTS